MADNTLDNIDNTTTLPKQNALAAQLGWVCLGLLAALIWWPELKMLWIAWHSDETLSHGPLIVVLAVGLLWMRRGEMHRSTDSAVPGGICLVTCMVLYVGAVWADVAFLRLFCLIGMLVGVFLFLGGWKTLQAASGALGLLVFMIPWPMTFTEHLAFPLQLTSSSYAGLLAGLCGVPVVRDGVYLMVVPNPALKPIYSMMVAQRCSGLTSLTVLLTLAYLIAYYTPLKMRWRAFMVVMVLPLTLLTNSLRLTVILLAGNYHSPAMAGWIHDHETPVLIALCAMVLMGVRHLMLNWSQRELEPEKEGGALVALSSHTSEPDTAMRSAG